MERFSLLVMIAASGCAATLPAGVRFLAGPVNGLLLENKALVYGDARGEVKAARYVLLTEARRDVVWAGVPLVARGAAAVVPERERSLFENPGGFWARLRDILEHPSRYRMPCLTTAPITSGKPQDAETKMRWQNFQLTFFDIPGQTLYHDGLLAGEFCRAGNGLRVVTADLTFADRQFNEWAETLVRVRAQRAAN